MKRLITFQYTRDIVINPPPKTNPLLHDLRMRRGREKIKDFHSQKEEINFLIANNSPQAKIFEKKYSLVLKMCH